MKAKTKTTEFTYELEEEAGVWRVRVRDNGRVVFEAYEEQQTAAMQLAVAHMHQALGYGRHV